MWREIAKKTLFGAAVGGTIGILQSVMVRSAPSRGQPVYQHPKRRVMCTLDTFGLEGDEPITHMMWRLYDTLNKDVTTRHTALNQYNVLMYNMQHFFAQWRQFEEQKHVVRYRLLLREAGVRLLSSLTAMEKHVWDAREVGEVMRIITFVHRFVTDALSMADKKADIALA